MVGDFDAGVAEFERLLDVHDIIPTGSGVAVDLGSGHGMQTVALANAGWRVTAVDFSETLLDELDARATGASITTVRADIRTVERWARPEPELIICFGDTLLHLPDEREIADLLADCAAALAPGGRLLLSFRDYTTEPPGTQRFIPVRSDDTRILTCVLDYRSALVRVTDLLHERTSDGWQQRVSSYEKARVRPATVEGMIERTALTVTFSEDERGMRVLIAQRGG